jgi:hypothetical protein
MVYSMTVTPPSGATTGFISFNPSSRVVGWYTSSATQIGTFTITVTGKIVAVSEFTKNIFFSLLVYDCTNSPETITITPSTSPGAQTYMTGAAVASTGIIGFTENSTVCAASDVIYSMTVTPDTPGLSTSFITFTSSTRAVSWQTNNINQVGSYTIQITGKIIAASTWLNSLTFVLTVNKADCSASVENNLVLTPSIAPDS